MKKSNLITGILYVLFGVACLIVALLIETKLEGILWGFAGAGIFPGIMMICKYFYWSSPENKERYEERLENERIEQHDELKTKIRDRAGRYTYSLGLLVVCFSISTSRTDTGTSFGATTTTSRTWRNGICTTAPRTISGAIMCLK